MRAVSSRAAAQLALAKEWPVGRVLACALFLLGSWSCTSSEHATQIVLRVRADVASGTFDSLQTLVFFGDGQRDAKTHTGTLPYVAVISPYEKLDEQVEVTVRALKGGAAVFETRASAHFQPHRVILLDVELRQACFDAALAAECEEQGKTCGGCSPLLCIDVQRDNLPDVSSMVVRQAIDVCGQDGGIGGGTGDGGDPDTVMGDASRSNTRGDADARLPDGTAEPSDATTETPLAEGGVDSGGAQPGPPVSLERKCVEDDQPCIFSVSLSLDHGCVVSTEGRMYCWGDNSYGQLCRGAEAGAGPLGLSRVVEPASSTSPPLDYRQVAVSARQTCAIAYYEYDTGDYGTLHCCGETIKDSGDKLVTPEVALWINNTVHIDTGLGWACAVSDVGLTRCFGQFEGERPTADLAPVTGLLVVDHPDNQKWAYLGDSELSPLLVDEHHQLFRRTEAQMVADVREVRQASSRGADCVLYRDGVLSCGGRNDYGQLGRDTRTTVLEPQQNVAVQGVQWQDVATWERGTCAVAQTGDVWCWGDNQYGAMGVSPDEQRYVTTPRVAAAAPDLDPYVEVEIGSHMTCAMRASENVDCWGGVGQMAFGPTPTRLKLPAD